MSYETLDARKEPRKLIFDENSKLLKLVGGGSSSNQDQTQNHTEKQENEMIFSISLNCLKIQKELKIICVGFSKISNTESFHFFGVLRKVQNSKKYKLFQNSAVIEDPCM
jgi:hypothetical protein